MKEKSEFVTYWLYEENTLNLIRSGIEAERMPERGDIIALLSDKKQGWIDLYEVVAFVHLPNGSNALIPQPVAKSVGSRQMSWP